MHLGGRCEYRRFDAGLGQAFLELRRPVRDAELLRDFGGGIRAAARQCDDLDAVDFLDGFDVFDAEGALAGDADFHVPFPFKQAPCTAGPTRCSTWARGRNDTPRAPSVPARPRMASHMTISMPSEPDSRMYLGVRDLRQLLRIVDHAVEEGLVEFLVHEAGAFTLELVRHAARAVDDDAQVLRVLLDGAANRLSQLEANARRWAAGTGSRSRTAG
jgi:hypothetical protein